MPVASDASSTTPADTPALASAESDALRVQRAERARFFLDHVSRVDGISLDLQAGEFSAYLFGRGGEARRALRAGDLHRYLAGWYHEDREHWLVFSCDARDALLTHLRENVMVHGLSLHGVCDLDTARDLHPEVEVRVTVAATEAESTSFTEYADDAA